ncbi:MAG: hypothetical protein WAK29_08970 [Terriglobales bacterium]
MCNSNPLLWRGLPVSLSIRIAIVSAAAALVISRRPSLRLQSNPMSLFLCAVRISAMFNETGVGLRISRSLIELDGSRSRAADQFPCGASSFLPLPVIIEAGA